MTSLIPYAQEIDPVYTLTGPDGSIAVFNDSTSPYYVGALQEVSGLDRGEVIESAFQNTEVDGGSHGNFFYGRRPFTLQGKIVPSSTLTRAERVDRLMSATNAMRGDARLTWTPKWTGATPLEIKFRQQQPTRTSGGFNKDFFISGVCADPRIYSQRVHHTFNSTRTLKTLTGPASHRHEATGGVPSTTVMSIAITWGNATSGYSGQTSETFEVNMWMKVDATWNGGTPALGFSDTLEGTPTYTTVTPFNAASKGVWQLVTIKITDNTLAKNAGGELFITSTAPTAAAGHYIQFSDPMINAAGGSEIVIGSVSKIDYAVGTNWTKTDRAEDPTYNLKNFGNSPSPWKLRVTGEKDEAFEFVSNAGTSINEVYIGSFGLSNWIEIAYPEHTVVNASEENKYKQVNFSTSVWDGIGAGQGSAYLSYLVEDKEKSFRLSYRDSWV